MSPSPRGKHQFVATKLLVQLDTKLEHYEDSHVYGELDWIVSDTTVFRPDIFVFCGTRIDDYLKETPHLIIEILSPSTANKDRGLKFRVYQEKKVPYYLLVSPELKLVEIYKLRNGTYFKIGETGMGKHEFDLLNCSFSLDFSKIW